MKIGKIESFIHHLILIILAILFILPLLWMIFSSVDASAIQALKIPEKFTFQNYLAVITDSSIIRSYWIGVLLSGGQSIIVVIVSILAAYPLSRYQSKFNKPFLFTILFLTSLPMTAVIVPVFQMFLILKFVDKLWAVMLFLTGTSLPYAIWLMKNFMDSVPVELEESAWIDGASVWQGIKKVVTPLMIPGIFAVLIFTYTGSWGNFFVPYILIQTPEKLPASVTIFQFFGNYGLVDYGKLAAFSVIYTAPVVILYSLAQRYMSKGFGLGGATKG
ncbi:carbohydrate ABC transporter permease [Caldibacillus debilis]|mgnify:CR=1 FL=1|uniref:carbohydrate ABC transporter permease n=1 Tax=Caldibacillus debilis TaxID=301148 RepID=UPI000E3A3F41|nr:carbohydrate ABC transporter permease [Caldibacillus debilis]REJ25188.1 MAG: carbohydrate ABC transporter permease [Caldibacillus debilis]